MNFLRRFTTKHRYPDQNTCDASVWHITADRNYNQAARYLCDNVDKCSAHVVVERNAELFQLADWSDRTNHAGIFNKYPLLLQKKNNRNPNFWSIGNEVVAAPGMKLSNEQIDILPKLALFYHDVFGIPLDREHNIGHNELSTDKVDDPISVYTVDWLVEEANKLKSERDKPIINPLTKWAKPEMFYMDVIRQVSNTPDLQIKCVSALTEMAKGKSELDILERGEYLPLLIEKAWRMAGVKVNTFEEVLNQISTSPNYWIEYRNTVELLPKVGDLKLVNYLDDLIVKAFNS